MLFPETADEDFEQIFIHVINLSAKDNTYKFAFARFLLEYCKKETETHVEFSTIAEYFLKYYWPQICKYKLRQNPQFKKRAEIITILEKEFDKSKNYPQPYDKIEQNEPVKIQKCRKDIEKRCFNDVTYAFQNVETDKLIEDQVPKFFEYKISRFRPRRGRKQRLPIIDRSYGVNLNPDAMSFFKRHDVLLNKAVTLEWARFLEKLNRGVPELIAKIEGEIPPRNLSTERTVLKRRFDNCFYCENPLSSQPRKIHVEHVIPFAFIAENKLWNLTLACQQCNLKKGGSLPTKKFLDRLIERNKDYRGRIPLLEKSLTELGSRFETIILDRYNDAKSHGFMTRSMP